MKEYEPVTLTHMQAYRLRLLLGQLPVASGQWGASAALSALYEQLQGVPAPAAPDALPGGPS